MFGNLTKNLFGTFQRVEDSDLNKKSNNKKNEVGLVRIQRCIKENKDFRPVSASEMDYIKRDLLDYSGLNLIHYCIHCHNSSAFSILMEEFGYGLSQLYSKTYNEDNAELFNEDFVINNLEEVQDVLFFYEHIGDEHYNEHSKMLNYVVRKTPFLTPYTLELLAGSLFLNIVLANHDVSNETLHLLDSLLKDNIINVDLTIQPTRSGNNLLYKIPNFNASRTLPLIYLLFSYDINPFQINPKTGHSFFSYLLYEEKENDSDFAYQAIDLILGKSDIEMPEEFIVDYNFFLLSKNPYIKYFENMKGTFDVYSKNTKGVHLLTQLVNTFSNDLLIEHLLLNEHYDIYNKDDNGDSFLHSLCSKKPNLIPFLLCLFDNIDLSQTNNSGETPFSVLKDPNNIYKPLIAKYEQRSLHFIMKEEQSVIKNKRL